jgi:hypothetical protein
LKNFSPGNPLFPTIFILPVQHFDRMIFFGKISLS